MKKIYAFILMAMLSAGAYATTVYCKMTHSWWTADGAAVGVYYWNTSSDPSWPGIRMNSVGDGVWSYDLPSDVSNLIFVRVNGSGDVSDWGAKTKNLTLPTDDKNLYTITNTDAVWGDPGCDGEWSVYGSQGGGENPGGQGGTQSGAKDYYLRGYFNGADTQVPTAEELFENGVLADFTFTGDGNGLGYFYVMECDEGQLVGVDYMLTEYIAGTHGTLVKGGNQKLGVQAGTVTFYLYDNGDGSLELSTEIIAGKTLVGGEEDPNQAIDQVESQKQVRKMIIEGQLRIVRGEKIFDATGRQL